MTTEDAIAAEGAVMLGSRLKRLAERLQSGAEAIAAESGVPAQASQMPLLTALHRMGALAIGDAARHLGVSQPAVTRIVGQLEKQGMVSARPVEGDRRSRLIELTPQGREAMDNARTIMWPRLRAAVGELCDLDALLPQIAAIEAALEMAPLDQRPNGGLKIRQFTDELAPHFDRINREWITQMYELEPVDVEQLEHPRRAILDGGGEILFVEHPQDGIIGTCALLRTGHREFELSKMGVTAAARGRKAGEFLLTAMIERAFAIGCDMLFLLTNKKSAAAIHLYERLGFQHDAEIMERFGAEYARCDVAMRYRGALAGRYDS